MTRESWRDVAGRVVAAFGRLVIGSRTPHKIGDVIRGVGTGPVCAEAIADQPFVVVGEATQDHYLRQLAFVGCLSYALRDRYYYFVETD